MAQSAPFFADQGFFFFIFSLPLIASAKKRVCRDGACGSVVTWLLD